MEVTNEEYAQAAQVTIRRLSSLCDYQASHIAELERQLQEALQVEERDDE